MTITIWLLVDIGNHRDLCLKKGSRRAYDRDFEIPLRGCDMMGSLHSLLFEISNEDRFAILRELEAGKERHVIPSELDLTIQESSRHLLILRVAITPERSR
jgi:hypothetical protein